MFGEQVHKGRNGSILEGRAVALNEFLTELVVTQQLVTPKDGPGSSPEMAATWCGTHLQPFLVDFAAFIVDFRDVQAFPLIPVHF